ncbi:AraC family transcriptional regulator [Cerasicoccus arenae]|uniref:HTH araC/xylS-type domain-containing protein n=1 Tax=Cerasicoccus arenae TaxID=424488 RepID=A0A8J3GDW3_9BACT|nr:AraC family transcriptional regulator [Cerasicoccus arenae]MBK1858594.1 helix-turn-helix transcriptional regulator [Cerasicoccus arenae]GHC05100.1 hypothetical protein GCM10007047_22580 [Cerasicoccus arenae]
MIHTFGDLQSSKSIGDTISLNVLSYYWMQIEQWNHDNLRAPYWRLYWNNKSGATIYLNKSEYSLPPNRITIIPPETPFSCKLDSPTIHFFVHFTNSLKCRNCIPRQVEITNKEQKRLKDIVAMTGDQVNSWEIVKIVSQSLAQLPLSDWITPRTPNQRILDAIQIINRQATSTMPIGQIAQQVGMNPNAFIRLFKEQTGTTPARYAIERRIEASCLLLHHSTQSIEDIASSCGFCDRFHFSRTFARLRGTSPVAFRKQSGLQFAKTEIS